MFEFIKDLFNEVGNGRTNHEDDVRSVRSSLQSIGYHAPDDKADTVMTRGLDSAIKSFQEDEDLKVDGWLKPKGPTETLLQTRAKQLNPNMTPTFGLLSDRTPLRKILSNNDDDVTREFIKQHEQSMQKMYLDTMGYPTVGVGFMIPDSTAAKTYPFYKLDTKNKPITKATGTEIEQEFSTLKALPYGQDYTAKSFQDKTNIGLENEDIDKTLNLKLWQHADELRKKFPEFDAAPAGVQLGLMDMQFNLGGTKFVEQSKKGQSGWPGLFGAYRRKDWRAMGDESHRQGIAQTRNQAVRDLFYKAVE